MKSVLATTIAALACSTASATSGTPGSIYTSLSVNSINKILNTFLPIMSYYVIDDAIIPLPFEKETFFYSVHIDDLHVEHFAPGKINFGFLPGTNQLRFSLDGADLKFNIDG